MEKISLDEFNKMLKLAMNEDNQLRVGQSFYGILHEGYPDIAEKITGTNFDPFYVDENLYEFMKNFVEHV
jgi:hypothetical protein